jgi:hypothetical protein|tara:strand:+ start:2686 stop:3531 length:846 start_codon:yes stop_codon:yes gene_type:complete
MEAPEISSQKVYIGPTIPLKTDQSLLTLNGKIPFDGTLAVSGTAFFGAPTNIGFARAVVNIGPAIPPFSPGIPTLGLDVTGGTQHTGYMNNLGLSNFFGVSNNTGLWNAIGIKNMIGLFSRVGKAVEVGGKTAAEPKNTTAALKQTLPSPSGDLVGFWKFNGTPLAFLHSHSDARLKTNVKPLTSSLSKVLALQGVTFDWTHWDQKRNYPGTQIGFIAQEVEKVVPEVVIDSTIDGNDGKRMEVKGVKYENLVALLVEAIKEQNTRIEHLESCLQRLESSQ